MLAVVSPPTPRHFVTIVFIVITITISLSLLLLLPPRVIHLSSRPTLLLCAVSGPGTFSSNHLTYIPIMNLNKYLLVIYIVYGMYVLMVNIYTDNKFICLMTLSDRRLANRAAPASSIYTYICTAVITCTDTSYRSIDLMTLSGRRLANRAAPASSSSRCSRLFP
jgi:hypothetical protein